MDKTLADCLEFAFKNNPLFAGMGATAELVVSDEGMWIKVGENLMKTNARTLEQLAELAASQQAAAAANAG